MAKGIYVGIGIQEFTSNPAPTTWTDSSDYLSATASNEYGEWQISASNIYSASSSYKASNIVDSSTQTFWMSPALLESDDETVTIGIKLPSQIQINPSLISVTYQNCGNSNYPSVLKGYNGNDWIDIATISNEDSSTTSVNNSETVTKPIEVTASEYYSEFRLVLHRYNNHSSFGRPVIFNFEITAGKIKLINSLAHKVKKIYVGADTEAFSSNPTPTTGWTTDSYSTSTASNEHGTWSVETTSSRGSSSNCAYMAFDGDSNTLYATKDLTSDEQEVYLYLTPPAGLSIKPNLISVTFNNSGTATYPCKVQGYNSAEWVDLVTLPSVYQGTTEKFDIATKEYFTKFRLALHRYSNTKPSVYIYNFEITAGEKKLQKAVARKVKKGYIGVGGVARLFFSSEQKLEYYGRAENLSALRRNLAATTVGEYALFAGGSGGTVEDDVESYSSNLTKGEVTALSVARYYLAATTVGNYALFAGGRDSSSVSSNAVDAYSSALARSTATNLSIARYYLAATTVGDYALFGGGYTGSSSTDRVDTYTSSLVKSTATKLTASRRQLAATTVGDYALFGGGSTNGTSGLTHVDTYTSSLVKGTATNLPKARLDLAATSVGNYALFGGGKNGDGNYANVYTYTNALVEGTATNLGYGRYNLAATTVGDYALFGGGTNTSTDYKQVDIYNTDLIHTVSEISYARNELAATTVGDYALFAGGYHNGNNNYVDAFKLV